MEKNVLVLLDSKELQRSITKGIVQGFLAVSAIIGISKFAKDKIDGMRKTLKETSPEEVEE